MRKKVDQIRDRLLDFSVAIIQICVKLQRTAIGRHIGGQLLGAGTSVGANYEEACGAASRTDFIYKLTIVYREIRESIYWLKLLRKSELLGKEEADDILNEALQIRAIIGESLKTAKENRDSI
jgi:four helix bundle protein